MSTDIAKDLWQAEATQAWFDNKYRGTIEACTGSGKTMLPIKLIQRFNTKSPGLSSTVVVPSEKLYNDWTDKTGFINTFKLQNVQVYIINSIVKKFEHLTDFLIIDEIHNTAADTLYAIFHICEFKYLLGLTATMERLDGRHTIIEEACPIIYTLTMEDALRRDIVADYRIINLAVPMPEDHIYEKIEEQYNSAGSVFGFNFGLATAVGGLPTGKYQVEIIIIDGGRWALPDYQNHPYASRIAQSGTGKFWRDWYAKYLGWEGDTADFRSPSNLAKTANIFRIFTGKRKRHLQEHPAKIAIVKSLVQGLKMKTILFGESQAQADRMSEAIGVDICLPYHSKVQIEITKEQMGLFSTNKTKLSTKKSKLEILDRFNKGTIEVISAVRALDEGFDVPSISLGIQHAFNSSARQMIQRTGRTSRKDYADINKVAFMVNVFFKDTQEEKWLKKKQKDMKQIYYFSTTDQVIRYIRRVKSEIKNN